MVRLALPILLLVLVAGCGGGAMRKPRLSQTAFVAEANRICGQSTTRKGLVARLHALRPPEADQELYGRFMNAQRDALEAEHAAPAQTKHPLIDPGIGRTIAAGKITGYARRLGLTVCARRATGTMPQ
jgi:hypothetical protein